MQTFLSRILYWFRMTMGLVPKSFGNKRIIWIIAHYTVVLIVFVLLCIFSDRLMPTVKLALPGWVERIWCGILFALGYAFLRLFLYLLKLLFAIEESDFPDLDAAWQAAMAELARAGISIQNAPLFVVTGVSAAEEQRLMDASRLPIKVVGPSLERASPLRVFANEDAAFLVCTDVGAMSRQLKAPIESMAKDSGLALAGPAVDAGATMRPDQMQAASTTMRPADLADGKGLLGAVADKSDEMDPSATRMPSGMIQRTMHGLQQAVRAGMTMLPFGNLEEASKPVAGDGVPIRRKVSDAEIRRGRRRFIHLCHLITASRSPRCPVNGMVQVLPIDWSQVERQYGLLESARADLEAIYETCHMQFPIVLLYTGMEELPGLDELLNRGKMMQPGFENSRAGSRYPTGRDVDAKSASTAVDRCFDWYKTWIYAAFARGLSNPRNRKLYSLLCELDERRRHLTHHLQRVLQPVENMSPLRLTGCYTAATGTSTDNQAFVQGVLVKLINEQSDVAWEPAFVRRDRLARFWGYTLLVMSFLLLIGNAILIYMVANK